MRGHDNENNNGGNTKTQNGEKIEESRKMKERPNLRITFLL